MAEKDNFQMVNFRLNLTKESEKELFEFLEEVDHGIYKERYGNKSKFIKEILLDFIYDEKEMKKEIIENVEQQKQKDFLKVIENKFLKNNELLMQALPKILRDSIKELMDGKVFEIATENDNAKQPIDYTELNIDVEEKVDKMDTLTDSGGELPKEAEKLPEDAMNYFLGL